MNRGVPRRFIEAIPLERYGRVDEVAHAVLFLFAFSSGADYITAAVVPVDGGMDTGLDAHGRYSFAPAVDGDSRPSRGVVLPRPPDCLLPTEQGLSAQRQRGVDDRLAERDRQPVAPRRVPKRFGRHAGPRRTAGSGWRLARNKVRNPCLPTR